MHTTRSVGMGMYVGLSCRRSRYTHSRRSVGSPHLRDGDIVLEDEAQAAEQRGLVLGR